MLTGRLQFTLTERRGRSLCVTVYEDPTFSKEEHLVYFEFQRKSKVFEPSGSKAKLRHFSKMHLCSHGFRIGINGGGTFMRLENNRLSGPLGQLFSRFIFSKSQR